MASSETEIAKAFVSFSQKGVDDMHGHVDKAVKKTQDFTHDAGKAEKAAASFGSKVQGAFKGAADTAKLFSIGGSAGIGGLLFGAGRGSSEFDQFGQALDRLSRTVGDKLAPYVRMASEAVNVLTDAWNGLGDELQTAITKWAVIGTAIAGVVAILPTLAGAVGTVISGIAGMVALIASPFVLTVAAIGGVIVAAGALYVYLTGGMSDTAESMTGATGDWKDATIEWVAYIAKAFATMWNVLLEGATAAFNWIAKKMAAISDSIADMMASWGEWMGLLEEGTTEALRQMENIKPVQINTDAFKLDPEKAEEAARSFGRGVKTSMEDALGGIGNAMDRIKKAGESKAGFGRGAGGWEDVGASWSRLQAGAAANSPMVKVANYTEDIRKQVTVGVGVLVAIGAAWPPVTE